MQVYILRGIPGAGKTTWSHSYLIREPRTTIVSADHYHEDPDTGRYDFRIENLRLAHQQCLIRFVNLIREPKVIGPVIVDNTNIRTWEIAPYYALAEAYGHQVEIVNFNKPYEAVMDRNIHGVPKNKVSNMHYAQVMEKLPPHWGIRHITSDQEQ